jgi:neutral ceramidase
MKKNTLSFALPSAVVLLAVLAILGLGPAARKTPRLLAGFARIRITPPVGTPLSGFGDRDFDPAGVRGVHDDLFVRALYLSQDRGEAMIMGFDLLFFSRDEADRLKAAIGDRLGLQPAQILLNTSHTHTGPKVGNWYYTPSDPLYLDELEKRTVEAGVEAKNRAVETTLWAGETRTSVPLSRRLKLADGAVKFAPDPAGTTYSYLPIVELKGKDGAPVCLLFSVACHPSTIKGDERAAFISADYPGAACAEIDKACGRPCALFLQGAGGDAKAAVIGRGLAEWRGGTWEDVALTGRTVASELSAARHEGLRKLRPDLRSGLVEMRLPLGPLPTRQGLQTFVEKARSGATGADVSARVRGLWAEEELSRLDRGFGLETEAPVLVQGIELGRGLRLVGVEGELTADLGHLIRDFYGGGITVPLGYSNGARMYLPSSRMIREGGYEVESYWEYRQPAPLLEGVEAHFSKALEQLEKSGIH